MKKKRSKVGEEKKTTAGSYLKLFKLRRLRYSGD